MKLTENEKLELKKSTSKLKEGIISIVSMLNKHNSGEFPSEYKPLDINSIYNVPKNVPKSAQEREMIIIDRVKKGNTITKRHLADEFGVNSKTIQRDLDKLSDRIKFIGSKKKGKWVLLGKK